MVRHADSQQRTHSSLIYVGILLLLFGAIAPACSCGETTTPTVTPEADVIPEEDVGVPEDVDVPGADADAAEPEADGGDADPVDAADDVADVDPGDDVDGGDEDADPDAGPTPFEGSCLAPVIDCLGNDPEAVSCTINTLDGVTAVSYGNGTAARWSRDGDDRFFFEAFDLGRVCYSAQALDTRALPFGWSFDDGDVTATVVRDEDDPSQFIVTCPDETTETYAVDEIQPFLPVILDEDDGLCQEQSTPQCEEDPECQELDETLECCEVVGVARCLVQSQCPDIPEQAPELDSCLTEMLDCFGLRQVPLSCNIDLNVGVTDIGYTRDRRAIILDDGNENYTVETSAEDQLCYVAQLSGDRPYDEISFTDPNNGDTYRVEFDGDEATVFCSDDTRETQQAAAVVQYIPVILTEADEVCEVEAVNACGNDADCESGLCCPTFDGNRCLNVEACPEERDSWDTSCMRPLMECFGADQVLFQCVDHGDLDIADVSYASGASATFFVDEGREVRRTFFGNDTCFEAVETDDGLRVEDLSSGDVYDVVFSGDEARIVCPDNASEVVERDLVEGYLPDRPSPFQCEAPVRDDACSGDGDCGDGQECCDAGDRNLCLQEGDCGLAQPRQVCGGDESCGEDQVCCGLESVRVCDPRLCGRGQVCCDLPEAQVCATEAVCDRLEECDLEDPEACDGGAQCCSTAQGARCLEVDVCPDVDDPWGSSCLFATFECQGVELDLRACSFDNALDITEADYASGVQVAYFNTLGQEGRRSTNNGQPCFTAIETEEGFEVQDLLTSQRFLLDFSGDSAVITCSDDSVEDVPAFEVRDYLPSRPINGLCSPRDRLDLCQEDAECGEGFGCCDIGDRNVCLTGEECEESAPRTRCADNAQCGEEEVCCEQDLVNVCDIALCGDRLCCTVAQAQVCSTENECNREDLCDPLDLETCPDSELCCDTELGKRCFGGVNQCPDPEDAIGSSCISTVLRCFGDENPFESCEENEGAGVTSVSYEGGNSARFFEHNGLPGAITADDQSDCYLVTGNESSGLEIIDSSTELVYTVEIQGPEATITCPGEVTSVVPLGQLRAHLPVPPDPLLCAPAPRDNECEVNPDCDGEGLVCCDVGDRNLCLVSDHCVDAQPRPTCEVDANCFEGTVCCEFSTTRVCDPAVCPGGETCCDVSDQSVCGTELECDFQLGDVCDLQDPDACLDGQLCCQTEPGTRCLDGDVCPGVLEGTCLQTPFVDCFGQNPIFQECVLREGPDGTDVSYEGGARNFFSTRDGDEHRLSTFGETDCFEAQENDLGWDILDAQSGETAQIITNGNLAFVSCSDETTATVPLSFVQQFLPAPPLPEQCALPEDEWQTSCLFSLMECSGTDLTQLSCVDYGVLVDRTEVDFGDGVVGVFSNREGAEVVQTEALDVPCFMATTSDTGFDIVDLNSEERYAVEVADGTARITCPDDSTDVVEAGFVLPYIPERPDTVLCDAAPRQDLCLVDSECGDAQVCCNLGEANACLTPQGCFDNTAQARCQVDQECGEGEFCCDRSPTRVCDPQLCGDEVCCTVESAQVCGTEDECNGIFHLCDEGDCGEGSLCCALEEGRRCVGGETCPAEPDPLAGSCIHPTLLCFGRDSQVQQCTDFGQADVTQVVYEAGQLATFYVSDGRPARRTFFEENFECFDAIEAIDGDVIEVVDLFDNRRYGVSFEGPSAVISCPDNSQETVPRSAVEAYFPVRPEGGQCQAPDRDDECGLDADCDNLVPGFECCDGGDRNLCVAPGTCPTNNPHATCDTALSCGEGQECCDLGSVRICDPTVCGADVCCNVFQARVCGSNSECNSFVDVCDQQADDCPNAGVCCDTNDGTRCFEGIEDEVDCPLPEDALPGSCVADLFACAGLPGQLESCVDLGDERLSALYSGGAQVVFFEDGARRNVSAGGQGCFTAEEQDGSFSVVDLGTGDTHNLDFEGDNVRVTCADDSRANIPRSRIEGFLPGAPAPEQCQGPEDGWRGSCLFGLFECFGSENGFSQCEDFGELNFTTTDYSTGNAATFFDKGGVPVVRTRDVNQQPCFRAEGTLVDGFAIEDLLTGEAYRLDVDGDLARVTCPDSSVSDVQSAFPLPYIVDRPGPDLCEDFVRDDQCNVDSDCGDDEFTCCDLGDQNFCLTRESCERSRPRPTCAEDSDCQEGTTCCEFGPSIVCDPDLCGDQPCCSTDRTNVCGSEDDCRGVFNTCDLGVDDQCSDGQLCCDTGEGTRCLVGETCPPPPDPLVGSCIFDLFSCFGRLGEVDSCVDYGPLDMAEVSYDNGGQAVFYGHLGQPARIAGDNAIYCFEAIEVDGGVQVRDLETNDLYNIALGGEEANILCPDATVETVPTSGVLDYLPQRPQGGLCESHTPDVDACLVDSDCRAIDPLLGCCNTGDETQCLTEEGCQRLQVRATCDEDSDCGSGTQCCGLVSTRVCDPTVCGEALCCDISDAAVCGTHLECNEILDVCEVGNNATCEEGQQCCDSLVGARCISDGGEACPPVPDLWEESCLFETFECFGAEAQLAACFDAGADVEATYDNGGRVRFVGDERRLVGRGLTDCFTAARTGAPGGGFEITDSATAQTSTITFVADQAQIVCADQTVVNVPRQRVESYLPARPNPLACDDADDQWRRSCLFGTFECFGADPEVAVCADRDEIGVREVEYTSGSSSVYYSSLGQAAMRTRSAVEECFEFVTTDDGDVFEVRDLVTGTAYGLNFDFESVRITCPGDEVQTVSRANVDAYLPSPPEPCDAAERNDQCQVDDECEDPQLVCCNLGDSNACATRDGCARAQLRDACVVDEGQDPAELQQGSCFDGQFCCAMSPVRVCDPSQCDGDQICCDFEEHLACGTERDCFGIVDVCSAQDPDSCAPGSTCCPTTDGLDCVVGDVCPDRENSFEVSCAGAVLSCFGRRDFESCEAYEGLEDRVDASHELGGELLYYTDEGLPAVLALSNDLPCYTARVGDGGATYEIFDARSDDVYTVAIDGSSAIITCADQSVETALTEDLLVFVPDRPAAEVCALVPRDDVCQNDGECGEGLVCCDAGGANACLSRLNCATATPRPSCGEGDECGDGNQCCAVDSQRVCNPRVCGPDQLCCDTEAATVCASDLACAGIFDECSRDNPGECGQDNTCCATTDGTRCLVGEGCPDEPDPVDETCLADAFECFGRDKVFAQCVDWSPGVDRVEVDYENSASAVFYSHIGGAAVRTRLLGEPCFEAVEGQGTLTITDLEQDQVYQIAVEGDLASVTCPNAEVVQLQVGDILRHIPSRPDVGQCAPAERGDECQADATCQELDPTFVCCDVGEQNVCATRETCARSDQVSACAQDTDCGEGTVCCELDVAHLCDPTACGDDSEVCCDLVDTNACATEDRCQGIVDTCEVEGNAGCVQGSVCCPSEQGLSCVLGDACPEPPDPVEQSCIASTLGCFGRDNVRTSCVDWGQFDRTEVAFEGGSELLFFSRAGTQARRASFNGLDCFDALATEDGFVVEDLLLGDVFTIAIEGETATVSCPFGEAFEILPAESLAAYLPPRPAAEQCEEAERGDECQQDVECGEENLECCNVGDRNLCLTPESCVRNQPRPFCTQDEGCQEGSFCCDVEDARVCDPAVCGPDQACCIVAETLSCATDRECNGVIDLCAPGDEGACLEGESCCATGEGTRCLVGESCPAPPDPLAGTCLEEPTSCFGREKVLVSCVDWSDNPDRTEAIYDDGSEAIFFTRQRQPAMRAFGAEAVECYDAFTIEDGTLRIDEHVEDENGPGISTHTVAFEGPDATVTCADGETFTVPRSAVDGAIAARPNANTCGDPERVELCAQDSDCEGGAVCCDMGDQKLCLTGEACFENTPRPLCVFDRGNPEELDPSCGQGTQCCELPSRVCDPVLCGQDVCCTVIEEGALAVCATQDECQGVFDACQIDTPSTCGEGELCCPSSVGNRCAVGECPAPPDPIDETCLAGVFNCFGAENAQDSCVEFSAIDRTEVTYSSGSQSIFYTSLDGLETMRATSGVLPCFDAARLEGGDLVIQDLLEDLTRTVEFLGEDAVITCGEDEFVVPSASVEAFLPSRPEGCDAPVRDDECQLDGDCQDPQLRCCDLGDVNVCGSAEVCARSVVRRGCTPPDPENPAPQLDGACPEATPVCCGLGAVRVCDPTVCGEQTCCQVEEGQSVCATSGQCNGVLDFCQGDGECAQGQLCCPSEAGNRCALGESCPDLPDPLDESCVGPTLQCYGKNLEALSCLDHDPLDLRVVSHGEGLSTAFYTHNGDATRRTNLSEAVECYEAVETQGGGFQVVDLVSGDTFDVSFDGQSATVTCPDETTETLPTADVVAYLPPSPDPNSCEAVERQDACQTSETCRLEDDALECCDVGEANICGGGQTCAENIPRATCDADADCGQGTVCCQLPGARVCNPTVCGEDQTCCNVDGAGVCASSAECGGVLDHCALEDEGACGEGNLCCGTQDGNRCVVGETCPEPPDPIEVSCVGATLLCFGTEHELDACTESGDAGVVDATYLDQTRAQFFTRLGRQAMRTYQQDVPCFDMVTEADGSVTITDILGGGVFSVVLEDQTATVTCPDETSEALPRGSFAQYFPPSPDPGQCQEAPRLDDCSSDAECDQLNPGTVCCDEGDASSCLDARSCQDRTPAQFCVSDGDCGNSEGCCERETVRVCDPILCGGSQCCDLENLKVCGGTPEACQLRSSCLAETLECFGDVLELAQCSLLADTGIIRADYQTGANALFFTTQNQQGRRASFDVLPCFQAIETTNPGGYEILDLQNNGTFRVVVDGDDAQVTCSDNQAETVPLAAITAFLPAPPEVGLCGQAVREDECQADLDCAEFGDGSTCCDGGVANLCLPGGGDCADFAPAQLCVDNADCPQGTGCCEALGVRVCDPAICGDDICCNVPSADTCSEVCLLCEDRSDCQLGDVCCEFTGQCSAPEACTPEPACDVDADCGQGLECCKAFQVPVCRDEGRCPSPCRSDADCDNDRVCCGDQGDSLGSHCSPAADCRDVNAQLDCVINSDCLQGQLCCRTLEEPACVDDAACPVACVNDGDCANGQDCCQGLGRTPVCVDSGSCLKELGSSCEESAECSAGLTCCAYDDLGDVCMVEASCGQSVPSTDCAQDPTVCTAFPLATCCNVNGAPQCSLRLSCDQPFSVCAQDTDCGPSGAACCAEDVDYVCAEFDEQCGGQ